MKSRFARSCSLCFLCPARFSSPRVGDQLQHREKAHDWNDATPADAVGLNVLAQRYDIRGQRSGAAAGEQGAERNRALLARPDRNPLRVGGYGCVLSYWSRAELLPCTVTRIDR